MSACAKRGGWLTPILVLTLLACAQAAAPFASAAEAAADTFRVSKTAVDDRKAVFATVETSDVVQARTRIGGTIIELDVDEGTSVQTGQQVAVVEDPKLELRMMAVQERIRALQSQKELASTAAERTRRLYASGNVAKARLDEAVTNLEVVQREIGATVAEQNVILEQQAEGAVLAPADGRVVKVHVTNGAVVLAGEPIATIAAKGYLLRMLLPERHARFIKVGDEVLVGERGMDAPDKPGTPSLRVGRIRKVYPELQQGRVVADVEVPDLGDFFVGERVRVYVATGKREAIIVPPDFLFTRYGLTFARLQDGREVVVQPGLAAGDGIEVLSGLEDGDILQRPDATP